MAEQPQRCRAVVAVGASAGGLDALRAVLAALPADLPAALVVVWHIGANRSLMASILDNHTSLRVKEAEDGEGLRPATVYTAPPDLHVLVTPEGTVSLLHSPKVHHTRPAADPLFFSVAASYGHRAVALVLTGGDFDGSDGAVAVKGAGGVVIAQNPQTAAVPGMPAAAVATGCVDMVLDVHDIAPVLAGLVRGWAEEDEGGGPRSGPQPPFHEETQAVDQISQLLATMGPSPEQVAETLRREGIQGLRDSTSFMNPVVRHLNRSLSIGGRLEVGAGGTVLRLQLQGKLREVPLPVAVQVFLDGFHRGLYPDLESAAG